VTIERPGDEDDKLDAIEKQKYRSGVGMLLYLVKHSRPDLSNEERELSKVMDGATNEHVKMLYRVVKCVLNTRNRETKMKPNTERKIAAYVENNYAGNRGNRRSITGYLIYFCSSTTAWKSKHQGGVTLSIRPRTVTRRRTMIRRRTKKRIRLDGTREREDSMESVITAERMP
jgi:hypothetical protein